MYSASRQRLKTLAPGSPEETRLGVFCISVPILQGRRLLSRHFEGHVGRRILGYPKGEKLLPSETQTIFAVRNLQ